MLKNKLALTLACLSLFVLTTGCVQNQEPAEQVEEQQIETQEAPMVEEEQEAAPEEEATTEEEIMEEETETPAE